ncbi:lactonase family protein [Sphingomonas sp. SRS2]|uniref:lactonase family protein n=1 Tax=Sphingomonas sp. SRS2 TaxID=133190 RepID=UPI000698CE84|nr:lactonase family protein [Sphingomonas sp. SRS2]
MTAARAPSALRLHVGTYAHAGGKGLYPLDYDGSGGWELGQPYRSASNASFGAFSPHHDCYYLVDEQEDGALGSHKNGSGGWKALASVTTGGAAPCYVALENGGKRVAVANYESGSIALFSIDPATGAALGDPLLHQHHGSGPNPDRQRGPHAHCVQFSSDGRWLYHVDLGTDQILAFPTGADASLADPHIAYAAPPGSGPRHLLLGPEGRAFLVSELASTLTVLAEENGVFRERHRLSTLPSRHEGQNLGGHIAMNSTGNRVYVSNRGHDSIAVFDLTDDRPTLIHHIPSGGASPRFFLLIEEHRRLAIANEEAGNVVIVALKGDAAPTHEATIAIPGAAFILRENIAPR